MRVTLKNSTIGNEELFAGEFSNQWNKFRDALRREDQLIWDEMFKAPEIHREAVGAMNGLTEFDATAIAMLIEQTRMNDQIDAKLAEIEERVRAIERK